MQRWSIKTVTLKAITVKDACKCLTRFPYFERYKFHIIPNILAISNLPLKEEKKSQNFDNFILFKPFQRQNGKFQNENAITRTRSIHLMILLRGIELEGE